MKTFIIIITIIISGNLFAQPKFVKATSQGWAGGMCCRTGTDYAITISGTKKELESLKIKSVCIGGMKFESPRTTLISTKTGTSFSLLINCGYSYDSAEENQSLIQKKPDSCNENCISYNKKLKEIKLKITEVEALEFIAYP